MFNLFLTECIYTALQLSSDQLKTYSHITSTHEETCFEATAVV